MPETSATLHRKLRIPMVLSDFVASARDLYFQCNPPQGYDYFVCDWRAARDLCEAFRVTNRLTTHPRPDELDHLVLKVPMNERKRGRLSESDYREWLGSRRP